MEPTRAELASLSAELKQCGFVVWEAADGTKHEDVV